MLSRRSWGRRRGSRFVALICRWAVIYHRGFPLLQATACQAEEMGQHPTTETSPNKPFVIRVFLVKSCLDEHSPGFPHFHEQKEGRICKQRMYSQRKRPDQPGKGPLGSRIMPWQAWKLPMPRGFPPSGSVGTPPRKTRSHRSQWFRRRSAANGLRLPAPQIPGVKHTL